MQNDRSGYDIGSQCSLLQSIFGERQAFSFHLRRYSWVKSTSSSYPLCLPRPTSVPSEEKHSRAQTYALDKVTSYQKLSFSATCSVRGLFCKPVMTPKLVDPTVTFGSAKIGLFVTLKASPRS